MPEADPDNDEFECMACHHIFDIEESVRVGDELWCSECADKTQLDLIDLFAGG